MWKWRRALALQALTTSCPWCHSAPDVPTLLWDHEASPGVQAAGTFGNTCQGELVLVLLKAEKTKAYQYHLGGGRPLYCLISHAELEFQFEGVFMNKINCILMRGSLGA